MTLGTAEFGFIRELVLRRSAIVLEPGKEYLVEARLSPLARQLGADSIEALVLRMQGTSEGDIHTKVVEALTTNETSFFRDVHPFESLRAQVLPELIEARRGERRLDIWCAASSSGQEPYTIAMVLEQFADDLAGWDVRILATDLSSEMVARCRAGRFTQLEVNRGLPSPMLVKHFEADGREWVAKEKLRRRLTCREMNLAEAFPVMPRFDLVFMRNVLIYFDTATKAAILDRVLGVLRRDGYLFLGTAETTLGVHEGFERAALGKTIAYRPR